MKFGRFFTVTITHEFLEDASAPPLQFEPTPDCNVLLKKHGLILNQRQPGRLEVLTRQQDDGSGVAELNQPVVFRFFVSAAEMDFLIYTKLPAKKPGEVYRFGNDLEVKNERLKITAGVIQKPRTTNNAFFGILEISKDNPSPVDYTWHFEAVSIKWRYYLIAGSSAPDLMVDGKLSDITFKKPTATTTATDSIAKAILQTNPGTNLFVFESDKAIPYRQTGRKNIQLINGNTNTVIINHLPNPDFTDNGIKIIRATA